MIAARRLAWFAIIIAIGLPVFLAWMGVSRSLGAHPWWTMKTALIGAPVGAVLRLVLLLLSRVSAIFAGFVLLAVAYAVAWYGRTQFAASYAEDAFAGKLWYFGWIGVAAGLSALVLAVLAPRRN